MSKTPADLAIEVFGGHAMVAEILGVDISRIYRWTYPVARGGTGGLIPQKHHGALFKAARERGLSISADDFILVGDAA